MNPDFSQLPQLAKNSIDQYFNQDYSLPSVPASLEKFRAGVFVTLYTPSKSLRGCVGTISPTCTNVWEETFINSRKSAFQDPRFSPVTENELSKIYIEVSVLHPSESLPDNANLNEMLNPEIYGVIIRGPSEQRAVLLPDIDEVDSWEQQIDICRKKGNIHKSEKISIERFKVDKFMESK